MTKLQPKLQGRERRRTMVVAMAHRRSRDYCLHHDFRPVPQCRNILPGKETTGSAHSAEPLLQQSPGVDTRKRSTIPNLSGPASPSAPESRYRHAPRPSALSVTSRILMVTISGFSTASGNACANLRTSGRLVDQTTFSSTQGIFTNVRSPCVSWCETRGERMVPE